MTRSARTWVASVDEAQAVGTLLVAFRDHITGRWGGKGPYPTENSITAAVERMIERADTEYLLAAPHDDAPPAGVCQLRFRPSVWMTGDDCELEDMFVTDEARGAGLGGALLDFAIERARARGASRIQLDVRETNEAGLALYRAAGFRVGEPGSYDVIATLRLA